LFQIVHLNASPFNNTEADQFLFSGPDGYTYIFRNSHVLQIDQRGKLVRSQDKVKISEVYENGPPKVDAVAYLSQRKKTYMFYSKSDG
jgi:hypothetical protein